MDVVPLSGAEKAGLVEMRRLKAALKRRDDRLMVAWLWHGEKLKLLKVLDYSVLIDAE